jgi:hypothetical protein
MAGQGSLGERVCVMLSSAATFSTKADFEVPEQWTCLRDME